MRAWVYIGEQTYYPVIYHDVYFENGPAIAVQSKIVECDLLGLPMYRNTTSIAQTTDPVLKYSFRWPIF